MEENMDELKEVSLVQEEHSEQSTSDGEYEARMIEAFVGKPDEPERGLWYAKSFANYNVNGIDTIKWKWSWWAFFGGIWFLLYRKAYSAAGALFLASIVASFIPFGSMIVSLFAGGFSTYFVYKTYKAKKAQIEAVQSDEEKRVEMMRELGGYNQWVLYTAVAINILVVGGLFIAIYQNLPH